MNKLIKHIIESKYSFNIDTDANDIKLSKTYNNSKSQREAYKDSIFVDLGLPSKTLWCKYNIGVNISDLDSPEKWCGDYYAWGEIKTKSRYDWNSYEHGRKYALTKYCNNKHYGYEGYKDNQTILDYVDDVAYTNGFNSIKCSIPEDQHFKELINHTNSEWVDNYQNIRNLSGRIFESKYNDNHIFIPDTGFCRGDYEGHIKSGTYYMCHIWANTLIYSNCNNACVLAFNSNEMYLGESNRCNGLVIRPVIDRNVELLSLLHLNLDKVKNVL